TQDKYDLGLSTVFTSGAPEIRRYAADRLKTTDVDQKGAGQAKFILLKNVSTFSGDYEIEPRSFLYEHLKFSDPTVHSVLFVNPIGPVDASSREFIKVQTCKKIAGVWKDLEDWTADHFKSFCLDKQDERIEELLIIVSNSE